MLGYKNYKEGLNTHTISMDEDDPNYTQEHNVQNAMFGVNDYIPVDESESKDLHEEVNGIEGIHRDPLNPKRLIVRHTGAKKTSAATSISVPAHVFTGSSKSKIDGMLDRNEKRAAVYGGEHRAPLSLSEIERTHKEALDEHFKKPEKEQIKAEKEAAERLHAAGHLDSKDTTSEGEKTDTVKHEHDEQGRTFEAAASKGVAGHAVYTSGHGEHQKHYVLNTCPAQTKGCGGGIDAKGHADTMRGTCFAPKAETQYVGAAVSRATHTQAKHDPAMTKDWILAHTGSLRRRANAADKKNKRFLFRPNVVDETDRSSRHVINHLNDQRAKKGLPGIISNSYGKTNEPHDPKRGIHVTFSNPGPKTKHGKEITENQKRDDRRIRQTISGTESNGKDIKTDDGESASPKNSYMVTNMKRGGEMDKQFQSNVSHAKYWSHGREEHELSDAERKEGDEGHYDGNGKPTTPDKAHYGHKTVTGADGSRRRYDYQKQHILHPRLVEVGKNPDGTPHKIPTDSRFMDNKFLPADKDRYKTKNGKVAGAILATTPTTSTSDIQHHSNFTHHVGPEHIAHAQANNGEYEIDKPEEQEKARGNEYEAPSPLPKKATNSWKPKGVVKAKVKKEAA